MRLKLLSISILIAITGPAEAAKVTNLDHVPHVVRYSYAGSVQEERLEPGKSTRFVFGEGIVTLMSVPQKQASRVSAQGVLAGTIGTPGTSIPADKYDELVIWPGGKMYFQKRTKIGNGDS